MAVKKKAATESPAPAKAPAKAPATKEVSIRVRPVRNPMHEPFQNIRLPMDADTLVVKSQWIDCQITAGLLVKC